MDTETVVLGALVLRSKLAREFVASVCSAAGVLYKPRAIREEAKARAEAKVIEAKADIKIAELQYRCQARIEDWELRRQRNIEAVVLGAASIVEGNALRLEGPDASQPEAGEPENRINDDWVHKLFGHCQDVGDTEMQTLWSKILAGEFASPGAFSLRTLNAVGLLSHEEANLFTQYCCFAWRLKGRTVFMRGYGDPSFECFQIRDRQWACVLQSYIDCLNQLQRLENCGLLNPGAFDRPGLAPPPLTASFGDKTVCFTNPTQYGDRLTEVGEELFQICGAVPNMNYLDWFMRDYPGTFVES
ncbi:MAG: DUF2806 domain-containing protein [Planctomycetaceae bacterium]